MRDARAITGLVAAVLWALLGFCGCSPQATGTGGAGDADVGLGAVIGSVSLSGSAVPGSVVSAVMDTGVPLSADPTEYSTTTDDSGNFRLDSLPLGRYSVSAHDGELGGVVAGVEVSARAATVVAIHLLPVGSLTGLATLGTAGGNAGILVWVPGTAGIAATATNGRYIIHGVPTGTRTVLATKPGFTVGRQDGVVIAAGEPAEVPDIALEPTGNLGPHIDTLHADPIQVETGATTELQVSASDEDGDALSFAWSADQGDLSASTGNPVTWTAPGADGSYVVTLVVSDGNGGVASGAIAVLVRAPAGNLVPHIDTLSADPIQIEAGGTTELSVSATDEDGDALSFAWSADQGDLSAATGNPVTWTAPGADGSYVVTVVVSDGNGGAASGAIALLVATPAPANEPPTISGMTPDTTPDVGKGEDVAVSVTASDPDGDTLTFVHSATGGSFTGSGSDVTWTAPPQVGAYTITCTVSDGHGGLDEASIGATVTSTDFIIF